MILLVPIGLSADHHLLRRLCALLETRLQVKVDISPASLDPRPFLDTDRSQYNSSAIIRQLEKDLPPGQSKVLGVAGFDLFIPILTFVFGEARLNGRCAVISSHRLDNRFYGLPENPHLLQERLLREAVHELGHTFGLIHCRSSECVMRSSTCVEEIDLKGSHFCRCCNEKMGIRSTATLHTNRSFLPL